ncbi:MAG: ParA family protein [Gordonia sp. (in: high G+C Gram-positive bacteria)]
MARVIATISLKGGVGKTTVTAGLAEFLSAEFGQRVLLIDLDSQINLTTMMISESRWFELNANGDTLASLFADAVNGNTRYFAVESAIQRGVSPVRKVTSVDLLASSLDLIELQEDLSALRSSQRCEDGGVNFLREALAPIRDFYDYVLIDCPPNIGPVTLNGLAAADAYIIPTIPDHLSTYGIPQIQNRVRKFGEQIGRPIVELGVVITKYKANSTVHAATTKRLRRDPTIQNVLPTYIAESNGVAAAAEFAEVGTLKGKYGNQGQFDQFRSLTVDVMTEARGKL